MSKKRSKKKILKELKTHEKQIKLHEEKIKKEKTNYAVIGYWEKTIKRHKRDVEKCKRILGKQLKNLNK